MVHFSISKQAFYDLTMNYSDLPGDLLPINDEQHYFLLEKINEGRVIFSDLTYSSPRPTEFHTWDGVEWVDLRTDDQREIDRLASFKPMKRRQFMRTLVLNGFNLDDIEAMINSIDDVQTRQLAMIDWKDATEFERTDQTLLMMGQMLNLTTEQIDAMWKMGLTL